MPRVSPIQTAFTSGDLSPRLYGRVDLAKYASGAETLENWLIQPQGGITRRPGSLYVTTTKDSTMPPRLIPFVFSPTTAYMLEVGHQYIRFMRDGAQIPSGGNPGEGTTP